MRVSSRVLAFAAMALLLVAALGQAGAQALKPVELNFYLLGPEPKDMSSISDALNALSSKDLNCTVKWTFLGWDKWDQKYKLALSSGETIDGIYTANWANYGSYAANGAFMELNDLAPKYAPLTWKGLSATQWNQTKVDGKIYTVPCDWKEYATDGYTYRVDIARKLGFTKPLQTLDDLEKFMDAVKKADPTTLPLNAVPSEIRGDYEFYTKDYLPLGENWWIVEEIATGKIMSFYDTPAFKLMAARNKRWYEKGFWSKDVLSNTIISEQLFKQGKNVVGKQNPTKLNTLYQQVNKDHPDWEFGMVTVAEANSRVYSTPSVRNGMAIPLSAKNPERALMYLDKLRSDARYYNLTNYGILGQHYTLDAKGNYVASSDNKGFGYQAMQPWGWHVTAMELPTLGDWAGYAEIYARLDKIVKVNKYATFIFDRTMISGIDAAVEQVRAKYAIPIMCGAVADFDKAIVDLASQMKRAGFSTYLAEVQRQRDAYLADQAKN